MFILSFALIVLIAFSVLAIQLILWQSADISVSIVSETDNGKGEVTISVLNTAGSTLLFYENAEIAGKIEYLSESGWVEYCDVSYTANNVEAMSSQYGGVFAELQPGESWTVAVPEEKISGMKNGTYRIKMTYITEKNYANYLDKAFDKNEKDGVKPVIVPDESSDMDRLDFRPVVDIKDPKEEYKEEDDKFLAESFSEVYIETFEYTAPEDFVGEVSFDESDVTSRIDTSIIDSRRRLIIE